jgi:hypothetical protein
MTLCFAAGWDGADFSSCVVRRKFKKWRSFKKFGRRVLGWAGTLVKFLTNFLALKQTPSQSPERLSLRRMQIADTKNVRSTENP